MSTTDGIYFNDSCYYNRQGNSYKFKSYDFGESADLSDISSYLNMSRVSPEYLWDAKFAISRANSNILHRGAPYSDVRVFPGGRIYYNVMDSNSYSYSDMDFGKFSNYGDLNARLDNIASSGSNSFLARQINDLSTKIMGLAAWKSVSSVSEYNLEQVDTIVSQVKMNMQLMALNKNNGEKLSELLVDMQALDVEANALNAEIQAEVKEAEAVAADEAEEKVKADSSSSSAGKKVDIDCVEGDTELKSGQLAKRYDIKMPVVEKISVSYADAMLQAAGKRSSFTDALTTYITEDNLISFLVYMNNNDKIGSFVDNIDDQSYWDNDDERSIRDFLFKFEPAIRKLQEAGYLTEDEADEYIVNINKHNEHFRHHFKDHHRKELVSYLKELAGKLSVEVDGKKVAIGSERHFKKIVLEKQGDDTKKSTNKFVGDMIAKSQNADELEALYDENKDYTLPEEITYLPNKQVFQAKVEGKVFQGKTFAELNSKIMKSKDENIILSWGEIKTEFLASLSSGS